MRHIAQVSQCLPPLLNDLLQRSRTLVFWFIISYTQKNNLNWWLFSHTNLLYHTSHHDINDKQILVEWCRLADSHWTFLLTHSLSLFSPSIKKHIKQTYLNLPCRWALEYEKFMQILFFKFMHIYTFLQRCLSGWIECLCVFWNCWAQEEIEDQFKKYFHKCGLVTLDLNAN